MSKHESVQSRISRSEVRSVDPTTGGQKGVKLADFSQVPAEQMMELAEHFGRGAAKYKAHNWKRGYHWSKSYSALQRHLHQFWAGEDLDPETGSKHIIAAAWHCFVLSWFMDNRAELDDRPTVENLKKMFAAEDAASVKSTTQKEEQRHG